MTGKFITIDGTEGSGKTTQIIRIANFLETQGKTLYQTREPGGTNIGEKIRHLLLSNNSQLDKETELLLIFAARCEHLKKEIWPRLEKGEWVISDRFNDATYAYQGFARGIDVERIRTLEKWLQGVYQPDLSLLLTLPEVTAWERVAQRGQPKDRIENESRDFFHQVAQGYEFRYRTQPHVQSIDASLNPDAVFAQIQRYLQELIEHD